MKKTTPPRLVLASHPEWVRLYDLAWRTAVDNVAPPRREGWKEQLTCMPGVPLIWVWDSCFMTHFARYSNGMLPVMNNLDNLYLAQREDGYISMAYNTVTGEPAYGERVNPPLFAWAELAYWRWSGDRERLTRVLPHLVSFFRWLKAHRRRKNGLYWFEDSGSTGMDNSPRSAYASTHLDGSDICHIDLIAQQASAAESLAAISDIVGEKALAEEFKQEHSDLKQLINRYHWDERSGFYYDVFNRSSPEERHNFLNHKTAAAFWPLFAGLCGQQQANRLTEHLLDSDEFATLHPVPTLSRDDPNYDPMGGYWLGGVWAPTNYMVVKGLERYGRYDLARKIAIAHLNAMAHVADDENYASIYECYAPEHLQPATRSNGQLVRPNFVGWSGLGPVTMLIEEVFGLSFEAPSGEIHWNLRTSGRHGIEDLHFNGGTCSLLCEGISTSHGIEVTIHCDKALRLVFGIWGRSGQYCVSLEPGRHEMIIGPELLR